MLGGSFRRFSTAAPAWGRQHKSPVNTRFPTKYNPVRSAFKQEIKLPAGVVFNPAPAAPTPYETPAAFLPESDARKYRKDAQLFNVEAMPALSEAPKRTSHLTDADAVEIQRLRNQEPERWTRRALAAKFGVSEFVIGLVSQPNPEYTAEMQRRLQTIQSAWSHKTARARVHRQWRRQYWLRDV